LYRFADGTPLGSVWDVFASAHVDNLAFDAPSARIVYPDPCTSACHPGDATGLQVFDSESGQRLVSQAIDVGFPPFEVVFADTRGH
jgi:hypothetical protein